MAEQEKAEEEREIPRPSPFPLFPTTSSTTYSSVSHPFNNTQNDDVAPQWLCNASFNTDLSVINDAVRISESAYDDENDDRDEDVLRPPQSQSPSYELLEEEETESDRESSRKKKKRKERKKKRKRSKEKGGGDFDSYVSAKSKDYYFDSHGDRDNLVYGRIYRYLQIICVNFL